MPDTTITAISIYPLQSAEVLGGALLKFLDQNHKPSDILRSFADMLDATEKFDGITMVYEHDGIWVDKRKSIFQRSFYVSEETQQRLRAASLATGLSQTSIILLALNTQAE